MKHLHPSVWIAALTMFAHSPSAAAAAKKAAIEAFGVPAGFEAITRERDLLIDIYYGGRKIGESRVEVRPGFLRFKRPAAVLELIPNVDAAPEILGALSADLPSNSDRVCSSGSNGECGILSPEIVGVILDEQNFRADVFVNRKWLSLVKSPDEIYLPSPAAPLSLTSATGVAIAGSSQSSTTYNLQNRTIVAFRNARLRTETAYASDYGLVIDTMAAELDRPRVRYEAGIFWAPGLDLTGQRRILGIGVGSQFETRVDHDAIYGTPLVLFLAQPAQVDVLVDGRLVASRGYEAGNTIVDASGLPDGSYPVVLRIHEANGNVREENRLFVKNARIAPVDQPIFFGYAGLLANTSQGRPIDLSNDVFYQLGTARRLSGNIAFDLSLIGSGNRPMMEAGAWLISSVGRLRMAGLASVKGDRGALLQFASNEGGGVSINFDLRRVWSKNGPLIPLSKTVDTFGGVTLDGKYRGAGSYTQASGSIGYRLGSAYLSVIGALRKDEGTPADYSIGPSANWPVVNRRGLQIALQADAQVTRTTTAGYVGMRMMFTSARYSVTSTVGRRTESHREAAEPGNARLVGDATAHFAFKSNSADVSVAAGLGRELDTTTAHAEGLVNSHLGSARGAILHDVEGGRGTRYALSLQTGAVITGQAGVVGGRNVTETAFIASIDGDADDVAFEVLVDDHPRGQIRRGERIPIFLQPYRSYSVRLRPVTATPSSFDTAAREITLFPGNIEMVRWKVERVMTVFGRALLTDGTPVSNAMITSRRGVGQSNSEGYFQIDVSASDSLSFTASNGHQCQVTLANGPAKGDYLSLGKVVCR